MTIARGLKVFSAMIIDTSRPIVVALGGNAISREGEQGTIEQQFGHSRLTASHVVNLLAEGCRMVITHGNGPQVGNAIRRVELARPHIYPLPIDVCVADTQGGMGYMIAQCINNELWSRDVQRTVCTLVTSVEVSADDPAFDNPTKPIGAFYSEPEAQALMQREGWSMVRINHRGWRRVVPSPAPQAVVEIDLIRALVSANETVIAGGGGGIPVIRDVDGGLRGVEGVVDKDRTSGLIATEIDAALLLIGTGVKCVMADYGTPKERELRELTTSQARALLAEGQFPIGSMGPKIESAVAFVEIQAHKGRDAKAVICDTHELGDAVRGESGTVIVHG